MGRFARMEATEQGRILVVDDEANVADVVAGALRLLGFDVLTVATGQAALREARRGAFDLFVLDIALPDLDGFEVCRRLRAEGVDSPVMFLTARTGPADAAHGLHLGGDDYVRKPFGLEELVARVRALLRRARGDQDHPDVLRFADVIMDLGRYEATRDGSVLELTPTEFRLLETLMRNPGRILTRGQILDAVWEDPYERDPATVETVVSRLRRKLEIHGSPLLHTRRGVGYGLLETGR